MRVTTYWDHAGLLETEAAALQKLVPASGPVPKARGVNRKLEKFRKGVNCYYDLYNNGLCNRAEMFRQVFGLASTKYTEVTGYRRNRRGYSVPVVEFTEELYKLVEARMDELVLEAAIEQGL